jgi:hypothetical protein
LKSVFVLPASDFSLDLIFGTCLPSSENLCFFLVNTLIWLDDPLSFSSSLHRGFCIRFALEKIRQQGSSGHF